MKKRILGMLLIGAAISMQTTLSSCERIDAGHVGIKVNMTGDNKGVSKITQVTGWNFYLPWASEIHEFPVFTQTKDYEAFTVTAKGGSIFTIDPTLNYYVNAESVPVIFTQYRKNLEQIEDGFIRNAIYDAYRIAANNYTPDSLISNRANFENEVQLQLSKILKKEGFIFQQLTSGITAPPSLTAAIDNKNKAVQEAMTAENLVAKERANAEIAMAKARGVAESLLISAKAESEANKLRQQSLTSMLIQQQWIEAWRETGGNVPNVLGSTNTMYQLPNFK
jgi:regulator of protease activity HflC (stomatin/prohibitin superfamily)